MKYTLRFKRIDSKIQLQGDPKWQLRGKKYWLFSIDQVFDQQCAAKNQQHVFLVWRISMATRSWSPNISALSPVYSTLPESNSSHLKIDGWETILSFWVPAYFQGQTVSFREGNVYFRDIQVGLFRRDFFVQIHPAWVTPRQHGMPGGLYGFGMSILGEARCRVAKLGDGGTLKGLDM